VRDHRWWPAPRYGNALNAADYALIPVSRDFLSLVGLTLLFDTIRLCQEH
jgi:cellulose biosynthesis protein BcsQ